jgi:probable phosphoglycerate mutase
MGQALRGALGERPVVRLHISDTGRALQTASLIAEELGIDWFAANRTPDLFEIDMGSWCGRGYDDVEADHGPITLADHLLRPAPDGEDYPAIAARLQRWIDAVGHSGPHIVVMHGISSRVLRGLLAGLPPHPDHGAPIAPSLVQGSIALIEDGREEVFFGSARARSTPDGRGDQPAPGTQGARSPGRASPGRRQPRPLWPHQGGKAADAAREEQARRHLDGHRREGKPTDAHDL